MKKGIISLAIIGLVLISFYLIKYVFMKTEPALSTAELAEDESFDNGNKTSAAINGRSETERESVASQFKLENIIGLDGVNNAEITMKEWLDVWRSFLPDISLDDFIEMERETIRHSGRISKDPDSEKDEELERLLRKYFRFYNSKGTIYVNAESCAYLYRKGVRLILGWECGDNENLYVTYQMSGEYSVIESSGARRGFDKLAWLNNRYIIAGGTELFESDENGKQISFVRPFIILYNVEDRLKFYYRSKNKVKRTEWSKKGYSAELMLKVLAEEGVILSKDYKDRFGIK